MKTMLAWLDEVKRIPLGCRRRIRIRLGPLTRVSGKDTCPGGTRIQASENLEPKACAL